MGKIWLFLLLGAAGYGILTELSPIESEETRGLLAWPIALFLYGLAFLFFDYCDTTGREFGFFSLIAFLTRIAATTLIAAFAAIFIAITFPFGIAARARERRIPPSSPGTTTHHPSPTRE